MGHHAAGQHQAMLLLPRLGMGRPCCVAAVMHQGNVQPVCLLLLLVEVLLLPVRLLLVLQRLVLLLPDLLEGCLDAGLQAGGRQG